MNGITDEFSEILGAYALDAVDDVERTRIERHLATCDACSEEVRLLREAATELARLSGPDEPLPAGFGDRIVARLDGTPRRPRIGRLIATVAAVAAVALAAAGAYFVSTQGSREIDHLVATGRPVVLHPTGDFHGHGTVYVAGAKAVVVLNDLPDAGRTRAYQLWVIKGGSPVSLGVLGPTDVRKVIRTKGTGTYAVTNEPQAGSRAPTTAPVLTSG